MSEWGEIAKQEQANYKHRTLEEIKASKNHIVQWLLEIDDKANKFLLEVGCGSGIYMLDDLTMGFKLVRGIELDSDAVKIALENNLLVIEGDMKKMPYVQETFDIVTAPGSIEHFPETELALQEINRVLKHGGLLLLNVPYRNSFFVVVKKIQQALGVWRCGYEKSFSKKKLISLLEKNGFEVLDVDYSEIEIGTRHPYLTRCLRFLDRIINGGHMIWVKAKKI